MPDPTTTTTTPPAPPAPPVVPPVVAPAAPAPQHNDQEPAWLAARLERERGKMLRDLGIEAGTDVKAALAELTRRQDAERTELEKAQARAATLEAEASRGREYAALVTETANAELARLDEHQRAAVTSTAGTDPAAQLRLIRVLAPTWAAAGNAPVAPPPAPANTTQPAAPPSPTAPTTENHLSTYESMVATNPMRAAYYRLAHADEIRKAKETRAG